MTWSQRGFSISAAALGPSLTGAPTCLRPSCLPGAGNWELTTWGTGVVGVGGARAAEEELGPTSIKPHWSSRHAPPQQRPQAEPEGRGWDTLFECGLPISSLEVGSSGGRTVGKGEDTLGVCLLQLLVWGEG